MEGKRPEIRFKDYDDEWVSKRFGDAFDFISNNTLSRDNLNNESGAALNVHYGDVLIKFGEYLDVQKEQLPFISDEALVSKFQTSLLRDGDVIIADTAEDTTVGKCTEIVCVDGKKIISGLHTMACRPKEKYTLRFLGYCLNSPKYHKNLLPLMQGVKVLSISKSGISDTNIVISENRDEQGKIANFLAALDREIKAELLKCEKLAILKKAMLKKMFPVGERKVPEIRFDGYTDDWEQRKVSELTKELTEYATMESGLPLLTSARSGIMYQSEYRGNTTTESSDTLFSVVPISACTYRHMSDDDTFHLNINNLEKGLVSREYPVFIASGDNDLNFLVQHINSSNRFLSFCKQQKKGGTRTRLYYKVLCDFELMVPKPEEQREISVYFTQLDNLITLHQCKLERLKNIKSACIKKMFV